MAYGAPINDLGALKYLGSIQHTNGTYFTVSTGVPSHLVEEDADAAFQALVDLVDGSPDFSAPPGGVAKFKGTYQPVTPT